MEEININERIQQGIKPIAEKVRELNLLMFVVIVVLFIGFASMFVAFDALNNDSNGQKQATYQDLKNQVQSQNEKIDALTQAIQNGQKTTH